MEQRTRMWKMLAWLVAAMTGTTVLLGWMDPSSELAGREVTLPDIPQLARMVVGVDGGLDVPAGLWDGIEVVTAPPPVAEGAMLAAGRMTPEFHFRIDGQGRPIRTRYWREQRPVEGYPHSVRIQVSQPIGSKTLTEEQRLCLEALIANVTEAIAPGEASLPVSLPPLSDM